MKNLPKPKHAPITAKLCKECEKYFLKNQKDGKISLTFVEFYAWVKHGYAYGVNSK